MPSPRRTFLASVASVAFGGCLGVGGLRGDHPATTTAPPDRDRDGVPDYGDDYPEDARRAYESSRAAGTVTLQPGEFSAIALTNSPRAEGTVLHYEASVSGATPVDCLVFERDAYDAYADGARDVPVVSKYSRMGVMEVSLTARLDRGEYLFAFDYTSQATAPGTESIQVENVVELAEPGPKSARVATERVRTGRPSDGGNSEDGPA